MSAGPPGPGREEQALGRLQAILPRPPAGEVWAGDDAAVVRPPMGGPLMLLAIDTVVAGLDADLALTTLADLGWKALAVNLSDIAAMGGRPAHAVVSVTGLSVGQLEELYRGLLEAAGEYGCAVVGGDLSGGSEVSVSVAVTGWVDGAPVVRSGARPGDDIWVSGPLGAAAAGLRLLRRRHGQAAGPAPGPEAHAAWEERLVQAHARPRPALGAGLAARQAGATAMIDVSDGFTLDLARLARSSGVDARLVGVPVAEGATTEEALGGGEDFVLLFTAPAGTAVEHVFAAGREAPPVRVGHCVAGTGQLSLAGETLEPTGWQHQL